MSVRGPLRIGVVAAALIAGPPLYGAVETGGMPAGTALTYGVFVTLACSAGAGLVLRIVGSYEAEQDGKVRAEEREHAAEAAEAARRAAAAASAAGAPQRPPASDVRDSAATTNGPG